MLFMSSTLTHVLVTITVILICTQTSAQETSVFYVLSDNQQSSFNQCQATRNCTLEALLITNVPSIIMKDLIVQNTKELLYFMSAISVCKVVIKYQHNCGSLVLLKADVVIHNTTIISETIQ